MMRVIMSFPPARYSFADRKRRKEEDADKRSKQASMLRMHHSRSQLLVNYRSPHTSHSVFQNLNSEAERKNFMKFRLKFIFKISVTDPAMETCFMSCYQEI